MKTTARVTNPSEVIIDITISATVKEWLELKSELTEKWPSGALALHIGSAVDKMVTQTQQVQERDGYDSGR